MNSKLWIKIKYKNYYKLIDRLSVFCKLYNVIVKNNYLYVKISKEDYEKFSVYFVDYEIEIVKNTGILHIKDLVLKNKIYTMAILFGIFMIYLLSNVIVNVEIYHENPYIINLLEEELESFNLKKLTFKKDYDELNKIKNAILKKHRDEIDWLEITVDGMKYVVKVEERIVSDKNTDSDYCNIYASKSGILKSINVSKGLSLKKIGDYVKEGDILISGDIINTNNEVVNNVCASGRVVVESWYTVNVTMPLEFDISNKTKDKRYNLILDTDKTEIKILRDRLTDYETDRIKIFELFDYTLYLEKQIGIKKVHKKYIEKDAMNKALDLAEKNMLLKLSDEDKILSKKVLKKNVNDSTIELEIFIITEEVIS